MWWNMTRLQLSTWTCKGANNCFIVKSVLYEKNAISSNKLVSGFSYFVRKFSKKLSSKIFIIVKKSTSCNEYIASSNKFSEKHYFQKNLL